jgi:peroxiredoxin
VNARTGRYLIIAAVAIAAAVVLVPLFRGQNAPSGPSGVVGQSAPVFSLHDDNGATVSLAQYRGKIVVMNLWASWCPPCRAEMPDLQSVAREFAPRGVVVIGVNEGESPRRASAFADSLNITFPIWIDDAQQYGRVYAALGLPTTILVGRDGNVLKGFDGPLTRAQMRETLRQVVQPS